MDSYIDIALLPDPEFVPSLLMNALFSKLHRHLAAMKSTGVGVSFPHVDQKKPALGNLLRLHATRDVLTEMMKQEWLRGMRDYVAITELEPVPSNVLYVVVRRVQAKSSPERLRRRLKRRHNLTEEEAFQRLPETMAGERVDLPYVEITSRSTSQRFRLFIRHQPPQDYPVPGTFNSYGLSSQATVPWF